MYRYVISFLISEIENTGYLLLGNYLVRYKHTNITNQISFL